jgi:lactate dehydrogenase-like 2-hydroxyacid dehydrogenase
LSNIEFAKMGDGVFIVNTARARQVVVDDSQSEEIHRAQ